MRHDLDQKAKPYDRVMGLVEILKILALPLHATWMTVYLSITAYEI